MFDDKLNLAEEDGLDGSGRQVDIELLGLVCNKGERAQDEALA